MDGLAIITVGLVSPPDGAPDAIAMVTWGFVTPLDGDAPEPEVEPALVLAVRLDRAELAVRLDS
jgi:hypothetical protein